MRVLVVEDEPIELKLMDHVLSAAGCIVVGVQSARHAIAAISQTDPEVVLLDMHMPGTSGLELLKRLRANPETEQIKVVAVTSFPERYPIGELVDAGCNGYLEKPLNIRTLANDLKNLVQNDEKA